VRFLVSQPWRDAERFHRLGLWGEETIPGLIRAHASRRPDAVAIVEPDRRLTWAELLGALERTAGELGEAGVERGDAVLVRHRDSAAFVVACAAAHAVQAVSVPVLATAGESEIAAVVERIRPRAYAGPDEGWECLVGLHRLRLDRPELWEPGAPPSDQYELDPDALMEVMFTSGTTGRPKGAMNSANTKLSGLRGFLSTVDAGPEDVWGVLAPMAHNAGWLYSYLPALYTGARAVFVGRGEPQRMLDTLAGEGVTIAFMVPTHAYDLMNTWKAEPGRWPLRLRYVITGAAACPPGLIADMRSEWGVRPISMYGMTECQGNLLTRPGDPLEVVANTVGRACPGAEVALRAPIDGTIVTGDGAQGEVVTRGATVYLGYYDDQAATAAAFTKDGWLRSGDLGQYFGENIRIVGRIKDVILRGAATILPDDVEQAIIGCPGVEQVAVVGLPDERLGEIVCACVVGTAGLEAIRAHLEHAGVGPKLWPDVAVQVDELPRTGVGKVQRGVLSKLAAGRFEAPSPPT
jgi:acyl-CoA synthetase (AMP-forming)/AMP-acid ligase II